MEDVIKPRHLLKDEMDYELKIRTVESSRDLNEKRKILARLFDKERDKKGSYIDMSKYGFVIDTEKIAIENTIASISSLLADFDGSSSDSLFARLKSRIAHVTGRVKRMPIVVDDSEEYKAAKAYQNETFATCLALDAELHEKVRINENRDNLNPLTSSFNTALNLPPPSPVVNCGSKFVPLSKWNIKFNGDPKKLYSFLEHLTEIAKSRKVENQVLFDSAVEFFIDDAFVWYRSVQGKLKNWADLVEQLKKDFLPRDIDDEIWEQIKTRKQRKNERVTIFIACVDNLFSRLSRVPHETTRVKYIKQNLLPEYYTQLALQDIDTVSQLQDLAKKLEDSNLHLLNDKSSNQKRFSEHKDSASGFCYSSKLESSHNKYSNRSNKNKKPPRQSMLCDNTPCSSNTVSKSSPGSSIVCWNCRQPNHIFQHCVLKRKTFCFRCGSPNFKTKDCPNCSKND